MDPEKRLRDAFRAEGDAVRASVAPGTVLARAEQRPTRGGLAVSLLAIVVLAAAGLGLIRYASLPPAESPSPQATDTAQVSPSPEPTVDGSPEPPPTAEPSPTTVQPTSAPTPEPTEPSPTEPSPTEPSPTERSIVIEERGVRITIDFDQNPFPSGQKFAVDIEVQNLTGQTVTWEPHSCDAGVWVSGTMPNVGWSAPPSSHSGQVAMFRADALEEMAGYPLPGFDFESKKRLGRNFGCSTLPHTQVIDPGQSIRQRLWWDGTLAATKFPAPAGAVDLQVTAGYFWFDADNSVEITRSYPAFASVASDQRQSYLLPHEALDRTLADPEFTAFLESVDLFNGNTAVLWFDAERDLWEVGLLDYGDDTIHRLLIDALTGEVIGELGSRPWDVEVDGYPP